MSTEFIFNESIVDNLLFFFKWTKKHTRGNVKGKYVSA